MFTFAASNICSLKNVQKCLFKEPLFRTIYCRRSLLVCNTTDPQPGRSPAAISSDSRDSAPCRRGPRAACSATCPFRLKQEATVRVTPSRGSVQATSSLPAPSVEVSGFWGTRTRTVTEQNGFVNATLKAPLYRCRFVTRVCVCVCVWMCVFVCVCNYDEVVVWGFCITLNV